jgi:hypothetical protein
MSRAFTPGPWRVSPLGNCDIESGDGSLEIATTHQDILNGGYRDPSTAQADAHLIAAAPELYASLSDAVELLEQAGFSTVEHRAALLKANPHQGDDR